MKRAIAAKEATYSKGQPGAQRPASRDFADVTITATNLVGATAVTFSGMEEASVTLRNATTISATVSSFTKATGWRTSIVRDIARTRKFRNDLFVQGPTPRTKRRGHAVRKNQGFDYA